MRDKKFCESHPSEKELQEIILQEKKKGTPDLEIGQKYGVTFRYIEKLITKSQGINISALKVSKGVKTLYPKDFKEEQTTVWSFKQRGKWATHTGEYRGNWSPYIPRNVILKYSKPGETVLDYFCGAGTTAVEAKLLGRKCIAFDINDKAIELAKRNLDFHALSQRQIYEPKLMVGDARNLSFLQDNSIELICAHPPYANIIHYTDFKEGDLSFFDVDEFLEEMVKVAKESFRVLRPGRQCAILIGDMRRRKHVIPLGFKLINVYLDAGFKLKELVIKRQHNCKTTGFWYTNSIRYNFLLLAHEYLPIFEKPKLHTPRVKEKTANYGLAFPISEKLLLKRKLDEFETSTVWLFSSHEFERRLNKNVIERYSSQNGNYSVLNFISYNEVKNLHSSRKKEKELLFIKSSFSSNQISQPDINSYLMKLKNVIIQELPDIKKGGFIAIQTRDIRTDEYLESFAKKAISELEENENLCLKEIVILTHDEKNSLSEQKTKNLEISHQYLLLYERV